MEQKVIECLRNRTHLTSCDDDGFCNVCGHQENYHFYEIHVIGKNGFSTVVITTEETDDDLIMLAIEQDKIESADIHYIDYIQEIEFEEWDAHFNFNR